MLIYFLFWSFDEGVLRDVVLFVTWSTTLTFIDLADDGEIVALEELSGVASGMLSLALSLRWASIDDRGFISSVKKLTLDITDAFTAFDSKENRKLNRFICTSNLALCVVECFLVPLREFWCFRFDVRYLYPLTFCVIFSDAVVNQHLSFEEARSDLMPWLFSLIRVTSLDVDSTLLCCSNSCVFFISILFQWNDKTWDKN